MFKESLRSKYVGYWIDKNNKKVSKSVAIKWIDELWYLDSVIANKIMFNPFKYSAISNSLDRNEDDLYRGYEGKEKEIILFKLRNYDDYVASSDSDE